MHLIYFYIIRNDNSIDKELFDRMKRLFDINNILILFKEE